ncbi:hypothetical protein Angca_007701 [Angiostrongylus cantonensis]|nr:hypothetical protein Angca_007701 [Angiostrongylus cantonensis]
MFDGGRRSDDDENEQDDVDVAEINDDILEAMAGRDSPDELAELRVAINRGIQNGVQQFLGILNDRARARNRGVAAEMRGLDGSDEESLDDEDGAASGNNDGEANLDFDVHESSNHQYLFKPARASEEVHVRISSWLSPGDVYTVPVFSLDLVVLPGQAVPMQLESSASRQIIQKAIDGLSYVGLLPVVRREPNTKVGRYGILLQVNKYLNDPLTMKVEAVANQRFRVISVDETSRYFSTPMAKVEVLCEYNRTPLLQTVCPRNVWKMREWKKVALCAEVSNIPSFVVKNTNLEAQCERLGSWMKMWFSSDKIERRLSLGPINFSYWAARNIPMTLSAKYEHLVEDETNLRIASLLNLVNQMTDLVCRGCGLLICSVQDIVNMNNEGTSSHFVNSAGYIHEMVTVSVAQNFVPRDQPSARFSWFPG